MLGFFLMTANILEGNVLETLKDLPACSVQCVVTSPHYYGLRDYGTAEWEGGDPNCNHVDDDKVAERKRQKKSMIAVGESLDGSTRTREHDESIGKDWQYRDACKKCGALRVDSQIGLEPTPEAYVEKLVQVFREVRRVLKDDGTLWLNLGDSYWGGKGASSQAWSTENQDRDTLQKSYHQISGKGETRPTDGKHPVIKPKDLIGIPWMVAFALRADGWYLRQDIIWNKPNPMPESVTDRCTKAHEYIFLLTKSKVYYYDQDAIREPYAEASLPRALRGTSENNKWIEGAPGSTAHTISQPRKNARKQFEKEHGGGSGLKGHSGYKAEDGRLLVNPLGRNKWSVWAVPTVSYKEAHFATFPPDLIKPCILAGTKEGDTVLDPFNGSGTTGEVSIKHNRHYIGCELNPDYVRLTKRRLSKVQPYMPEQSLTQREPDKRDSVPSQAFSTPDTLFDLEGLS